MIKAGNHTVSDKGFTVVTENIGGVPRQAVVAELPGTTVTDFMSEEPA